MPPASRLDLVRPFCTTGAEAAETAARAAVVAVSATVATLEGGMEELRLWRDERLKREEEVHREVQAMEAAAAMAATEAAEMEAAETEAAETEAAETEAAAQMEAVEMDVAAAAAWDELEQQVAQHEEVEQAVNVPITTQAGVMIRALHRLHLRRSECATSPCATSTTSSQGTSQGRIRGGSLSSSDPRSVGNLAHQMEGAAHSLRSAAAATAVALHDAATSAALATAREKIEHLRAELAGKEELLACAHAEVSHLRADAARLLDDVRTLTEEKRRAHREAVRANHAAWEVGSCAMQLRSFSSTKSALSTGRTGAKTRGGPEGAHQPHALAWR